MSSNENANGLTIKIKMNAGEDSFFILLILLYLSRLFDGRAELVEVIHSLDLLTSKVIA